MAKVVKIGEFFWTSGPVLLGPDALRLRWREDLPAPIRKTLKKVKKVSVVKLDGASFLAVPIHNELGWRASDRVLVAPTKFGYDEEMNAAYKIDLASVAGWTECARVTVGKTPPVWFDPHAISKTNYTHQCKKAVATGLAPGRYVVEIAAHEIPSALTPRKSKTPMQVLRFRKPEETISYRPARGKAALPALREVTKETIAEAKKLKFTESAGGPLVLMSRAAAKKWIGEEHYDLACETTYVAITKFSGGQVLVLGEPNATAFYPTKDGGILVGWVGADTAAELLTVAKTVPEKDWKKVKGSLVVDGELVLFDAARDGTDRGGLPIELPKGTYTLDAVANLQTEVKHGKKLEGVMLQAFRLRRQK